MSSNDSDKNKMQMSIPRPFGNMDVEAAMHRKADQFMKSNAQIMKGSLELLLYGPPGTGKTSLFKNIQFSHRKWLNVPADKNAYILHVSLTPEYMALTRTVENDIKKKDSNAFIQVIFDEFNDSSCTPSSIIVFYEPK